MVGVSELIENNRIDDVQWLCSLSESELDVLISLKKMVVRRAMAIGHEELAEKVGLKLLRALGLVVMEHFREKIKDLPPVPGLDKPARYIDCCNLLKSKLGDDLSIEELKSCLKRPEKRAKSTGSQGSRDFIGGV
ncbi:hypothetical protein LINGRAHAP2_LOCUS20351 [Linum grandiflorum]